MNVLRAYVHEFFPGGFWGNDYDEAPLERRVRLLEEKVRTLEAERETPQENSSQQISGEARPNV